MYQSIQACRAVAAILVVCFHLAANLAKDKYFGADAASIERFCSFGGTAGVAFFFVLSGFIIVLMHRKDFGVPERLVSYLRKRAVRIYPTYLFVFAGVYLLALTVPALRDAMPTAAGVLVKALLLLPQDPAVVGGTGAPVIIVAWSLQYELIFYAVVGLAIVHRLFFAGAVVLFAANFIWHVLAGSQAFPGAFFANDLMLLFGIGGATAWVVQSGWRMPHPMLAAVLAAGAFFTVGAMEVVFRDAWPKPALDLCYGLCGATLIVALVQAEQRWPERFRNRFVSLLGDASYALYLIHFPLIAVLCKLAVAGGLRGGSGMVLSFVGIFAACIATSVLFHLWIERPTLRALSPAKPARMAADPALR